MPIPSRAQLPLALTALALALLCPPRPSEADPGRRAQELLAERLPICAADEFLVYRGGALACGPAARGPRLQGPDGRPVPDCGGGLLTKQGGVLTCTARVPADWIDRDLLLGVERRAGELADLTDLAEFPPGLGRYVGPTTRLYTGHIKIRAEIDLGAVQDNGLRAASKVCEKDYGARAHMCTVPEIFLSAIYGPLRRDALFTESYWIYSMTFNNPLNSMPNAGLGDNCAAYSNESGTTWQGTAFQWRMADTPIDGKGDVAPHFYSVGCFSQHKIACCR